MPNEGRLIHCIMYDESSLKKKTAILKIFIIRIDE